MNLPGLKNLCMPAMAYLVLSAFTIFIMFFQNLGEPSSYCIGRYSCNVSDVSMLFLMKIVYVLFWTWILNIICRDGFEGFAWILVLLPYLLMFIFILTLFIPN
jgi:hypothetical protein